MLFLIIMAIVWLAINLYIAIVSDKMFKSEGVFVRVMSFITISIIGGLILYPLYLESLMYEEENGDKQ